MFQDGDRRLAAHRRKLFKEDIQRVTFFKVVEEILDRESRACEDWRSTLYVGIDDDQWLGYLTLRLGRTTR